MNKEELKDLRQSMSLTQSQLAKLLGIKQKNYSRLETCYENRKPTLQQIASLRLIKFIYDKKLLEDFLD